MTRTYSVSRGVRLVNRIVTMLMKLGLGGGNRHLLTVVGRKSGKSYTTPVSLVEQDGRRYLVAPYGEVAWVKNARAAGKVKLATRSGAEEVAIESVDAHGSAPVLKSYLQNTRITRPYFEIGPDAGVEEFETIAPNHPVFLIRPIA